MRPSHRPVPVPPQPEPPVTTVDEAIEQAWEELVALAKAPRRGDYTAVGTAQVEPLPHQARLIYRVVASYPRGYLFADEVGLGKTIEAGLVLRELLLSGKAHKVLVLVPASVIRQWQEELHEKISLDVPRYTGNGFEDRHGNPVEVAAARTPGLRSRSCSPPATWPDGVPAASRSSTLGHGTSCL